jgi:hypothetical protein
MILSLLEVHCHIVYEKTHFDNRPACFIDLFLFSDYRPNRRPDQYEGSRLAPCPQLTTRSPMGAIMYTTGGILADDGWIRILGSGSTRLPRSLPDWNKGKTFITYGERAPFLLVADDAIGNPGRKKRTPFSMRSPAAENSPHTRSIACLP